MRGRRGCCLEAKLGSRSCQQRSLAWAAPAARPAESVVNSIRPLSEFLGLAKMPPSNRKPQVSTHIQIEHYQPWRGLTPNFCVELATCAEVQTESCRVPTGPRARLCKTQPCTLYSVNAVNPITERSELGPVKPRRFSQGL